MLGFSAISETAIAEIPSVASTPSSGSPWYYYQLLGDSMNGYLRQSTGSQTVTIGPFLDDTDFKTPETGLTIANTDIKLRKAGATVVNKNSGGATADGSNGLYLATFDATDTNTVGILSVDVKVSGALVWRGTWVVLEEAIYDAMFAASAPGYLQPTTAGRTLDVSAGGEAGIDWANIGSPTTTQGLTGTTISTSQAVASVSGAVGSVTGAVGSVTGNVGGNVTGSVGSLGTQAKLDVNAEADTALADYDPPTRTELSSDRDSILSKMLKYVQLMSRSDSAIATDNATELTAINANGGSGGGTFANTTDALEALQAASPPSAAAIADAVWDEATSGHSTAGTTGKALTDAGSAGDPWSTAVPGAYSAGSAGYILGTNLNATVGSRSTVTNASVADQVWEELLADHSGTAGSVAEALNAAGSAGDPWTTTLPGSYSAGQAGKIIGDNLNATISSRSSHSAADVWSVGTRTLTSFGTLVADTWAYTSRILTAGTNIVLAKGTGVTGFNDLSAAQVNAEVDTALAEYDPPTRTEATADKTEITALIGTPATTNIAADIAAVKTDTTTLTGRITASVYTLFTNLTAMITGSGGTAKYTTTALANAPGGGGAIGDVSVGTFTAAALSQLSGRSVTITVPAYNANTERFDLPLTKGDSYLGGNAIQLTIMNWTGQDLDLSGTTITINGTRRVDFNDDGTLETLSWAGGVATASGSNWIVEFELDTTDTNVTAGNYIWSMVAEWTDGDRVTIVKDSLLTIQD